MKNYHAVGIAICSAVIITCALSLTDTVHAAEIKPVHTCPKPDNYNTGWVVTDENKDGTADHMWKVFNSGPCKGQLVDPNDDGIPKELAQYDKR